VTLKSLSTLQNQMIAQHKNVMDGILSVFNGVRDNSIQLSLIQQKLTAIQTDIENLEKKILSSEFNRDSTQIDVAKTSLMTILYEVQPVAGKKWHLTGNNLDKYQNAMKTLCEARIAYAALPSQNGYTSIANNPTLSEIADNIDAVMHYDLVMGLLPDLIQVLGGSLPTSYYSFSNVPERLSNPIQWAKIANTWLEARVLTNTPAYDFICSTGLWNEGFRLQMVVQEALSLQRFKAILQITTSTAVIAMNALEQRVSSLNHNDLIEWISSSPEFKNYEDACLISSLLISLSHSSGLGANGFTSGFVPGGTPTAHTIKFLTTPTPASKIIRFSTISTKSQFLLYMNNTLNYSFPINATEQETLLVRARTLFNSTIAVLSNTIETFYPKCAKEAIVVPGLPYVSTTMRRLLGFMGNNTIPFSYKSQTISIPTPAKIGSTITGTNQHSSGTTQLSSGTPQVSTHEVTVTPNVAIIFHYTILFLLFFTLL